MWYVPRTLTESSCFINGGLQFHIPPGLGLSERCEDTGKSNSGSLYYTEIVKCLCNEKSNKLKLSFNMKSISSDLHGYLLSSLLSDIRVPVRPRWIIVLSGPTLQMRREFQGCQRHSKKHNSFLDLVSLFHLNQEFSEKIPHHSRQEWKEPKDHKTEAAGNVRS